MIKKLKISRKSLFISIFISLAVLWDISSQDLQNVFKNLNVKDGLSQNGVMSIYKDSDGFMWFGTRDGLNRYDGHSYKVIRNDINNDLSLSNNTITSIVEDEKGILWVGTENGLNKFDPKYLSVNKHYLISDNSVINGVSHINDLCFGINGNLWVGTMSGLHVKKSSEEGFKEVNLSTQLSHLAIMTICEDNLGNLWLGTLKNGLIRFNPTTFEYSIVRDSNPENYITTIVLDDLGNLWAGTLDGFLIKIYADSNSLEYFDYNNDFSHYPNHAIRDILIQNNNTIWIGTFDGLFHFDLSTKKTIIFRNDDKYKNSISHNSIRSLYLDDLGRLWVGTHFGGVNILQENNFRFQHFVHNAYLKNTLSYNHVGPIEQDWDGNIWFGTEGGGIDIFNPKTKAFKKYMYLSLGSNSIGVNTVKDLEIDKKNKLVWIGTRMNGVVLSNPSTGTNLKFTRKKDGTGLISDNITSLCLDNKSRLWVGTRSGLNLISKNENGEFVIREYKSSSVSDVCLTYDQINTIYQDVDNNIWIGTKLNGLMLINEDSGSSTSISKTYDLSSPQENNVNCIFQDSRGRIVFGTYGAGLFVLENHSLKNYLVSSGLPNNIVYGVLEEQEGVFWVSSSNVLSRFDLASETFVNYTPGNGLSILEFSQNSAFKTPKGDMFFGGINGFIRFEPEKLPQDFVIPRIVFTGLKLFNEDINPKIKSDILPTNKRNTPLAQFNHNQNIFTVEYAALNYPSTFKNKYAYMLEGFDNNWNYVDNQNFATYTNLDAGSYKFKVKSSTLNGAWSDEFTILEISKKPPFWKSTWAYLLYFILISLVFFIIRKYTLIKLKLENNLNLARLERKNIEDLSRLKVRFFTNISHDFRTPLTLISGPLQQISKQLEQKELMPLFNIIERNVLLMLRLVNQLMDFRKIESNSIPLRVEQGQIVLYLKEISSTFKEFAVSKNIKYIFYSEISFDELFWFDRDKLEKIMYNILSNAFKYTDEEGEIKVNIQKSYYEKFDDEYLKITIKNSGYGIDKEELKKIFLPFYRSDNLNSKTLYGAGIGLSLVKDLVEIHKGHIEVDSVQGVSTLFSVYLPIQDVYEAHQKIKSKFTSAKPKILDISLNSLSNAEKPERPKIKSNEKPTILLVEDNDDLRKYICQSLKDSFFFHEANNGKVAIDLLDNMSKALPDIIISDVMMPEVSGIELCKYLKKNKKTSGIPIILLTARTDPSIEKYSYSLEIEDYMTKPFDLEILKLKLSNIISRIDQQKKRSRKDILLDKSEIQINSNDEEFLLRISEYIRTHINSTDLSVEKIGKEIGLSRVQLFRKVKKITGVAPTEFIRNFKLEVAAELLIEDKYNINEVCYNSGFRDINYFRRCFKNKYGVSPTNYRQAKNRISLN
ncbi:response regulator [Tamlana fucoidanivorans]|uniref:histidine kinase n=1 Tax=Allotamlana fucoidanivorans TaxID=2583814 RepID=A0A5C4SPX1_9FLAO|nr:hybrid sensor histidine kinase/response regulator transcription factor [Tamlana fucoidanivorans]TNJ46033.1 response regulator [Tamlana fucoidanivorans]